MIRQSNIFAPGGSTSDDDLIEWIIREEGFNKVPEDIGDGKMTLGSGLTDPKWHALFKKRGNKWSNADNRRAVAEEVASRRRWAEKNIPNWGNLPDSAQKALISYKYNYDFNAKNSPKLFDALSRGDYREAAIQIDATSKNPDFKNGLMKRRKREQAWFLSDFNLPSDTHTLDAEVPYTPMSMLPFSTAVNNPYILPEPEPMMVPREDEYIAVDYDAEQRVRENALRALENQRIVDAIQMMGDWGQKPAPKTEVFQPSSKYNFVVNRNADGGKLNGWDNLSLAEKAEMMKVAIKNGVTDLNEIKERYNEFAEGGNIYDGESEPTQQMKLGRDYWQSQVAEPNWYDTIDPPVNGKPLQEIIVTPTNDQNWLFSQGKYARNSRPPLVDEPTRKVVAKYLSKYDNEDAAHYNDRVTRLADAIYRTNGVIFRSNDVKKGKYKNRAHYNPNEGIAYVNSMDDLFSELAHPYQDWLGNNRDRDEYVKEYDADIDPRGGTRYAYPDTFEGETHGFFEPALTEYITTGKISRSLPMLNKILSDEKITPKDWKEVTDSAASWDKQAIGRRIISMPSQLPLFDRIKYSIIDYPLLEKNEYPKGGSIYIKPSHRGKFTALKKRTGHSATWFKEHGTPAQKKMAVFALNSRHWKHGLGGNLFDGLTQPTQFMEEDRFATTNLPEITVTAPRKYIAGYDDNGNPIYTENARESMGYTPYTGERTKYQEWANRDKNAPKYSDAFVKAAQGLIGAPLATITGAPIVEAATSFANGYLAPGSSFWMNPITKQMVTGTAISEGVNLANKAVSGYNTVGEGVGDLVQKATGWNPNNSWLGPLVTEAFNPGWYVSPNGIMNTVEKAGGTVREAVNSAVNKLPWTYRIPENPNMAYRRMGPLERDWIMEGNELGIRAINPATELEREAAVAAEKAKNPNRRFVLFKAGAEHGGRKQFAKGQPWKGTTVTHGEEQVLAVPGENLPWVSGRHFHGPQGNGFGVGDISFEEAPFGSHIDLLTEEGYTGVNPSLLNGSVIYSPFKIFGHNFGYKKLYPASTSAPKSFLSNKP